MFFVFVLNLTILVKPLNKTKGINLEKIGPEPWQQLPIIKEATKIVFAFGIFTELKRGSLNLSETSKTLKMIY